MKKFTKVSLIIAAVAAGVGLISLIGAFGMGLTWGNFRTMVRDNEFSFGIGKWQWIHNIDDYLDDEHHAEVSVDGSDEGFYEFEDCRNLDVEIDAGTLQIAYGDVDNIQVTRSNTVGFEAKVKGHTLKIESGFGVNSGKGSIQVILPRDMALNEVDLEVAAGIAELDMLDMKKLSVDVGAGQFKADLPGTENDYNYEIECGAGHVEIGESSYGGLVTERKVRNPGANKKVEIDCGVGEVLIDFEK